MSKVKISFLVISIDSHYTISINSPIKVMCCRMVIHIFETHYFSFQCFFSLISHSIIIVYVYLLAQLSTKSFHISSMVNNKTKVDINDFEIFLI